MRNTSRFTLTLTIGAAFLLPASSPATAVAQAISDGAESLGTGPSIDHTFAIKGRGENDKGNYTGTATISKIGGDMYKGTWKIGASTFYGVCFRDDDQLSCGWGLKAKDAGVVAYLVKGDGLDGVWFNAGDSKLGKEYLKPKAGKMAKGLNGAYGITNGSNPDGSKYSGTADITTVQEGVFTFNWVLGGAKIKGVGVRLTGGQDDVIAAAFENGGTDYGALQYAISKDGKELSGLWVQSINGKIGKGSEQLSRK